MGTRRRALVVVLGVGAAALAAPPGALAGAGDVDTGFGSKGIALIPTGNAGRSSAEAVVLQGDKLVLVGQAAADTGSGTVARLALTRLNADGARDTTFGSGGETLLAAGTGESEGLAVTLAPDGRIVVTGSAVDGAATKVLVARFSADGQPDAGFGTAGVTLATAGDGASAAGQAVVVEADGRVVVAGQALDGGANKLLMARFSPGGAQEPWGGLTPAGAGTDTRANALVRLADGTYVAAGRADDGAVKLLLARFAAADGQLTPGWGTTGTGRTLKALGDGGTAIANAVTLSGGRLLAAGSATDTSLTKTFVAAFGAAGGQGDGTFGTGGATLTAVGTGGNSAGNAIAVAPDGKILLGGTATDDQGGVTLSQFTAVRYLAGGQLDATFAPLGVPPGAALVPAAGQPAFGNALALAGDGKILVAGRVGDGDGETLAATRLCATGAAACTGEGPGGNGGGGGTGGDGPRAPFECGKTIRFGIIEAEGCLKEVGGRFEADGRLLVNGLVLQPEARSTIVLDPKALHLYVDGPGKAAGQLTARLGSITIFENLPLDVRLPSAALTRISVPALAVSPRGSLFGFPLAGKSDLALVKGGIELNVEVSLPKIFGGVTGSVTLRADIKNGFRPDGLRITAREALLGPLRVKDVLISYKDSEKLWQGQATVFLLPFPYGASGAVAVQNGTLKTLVAGVDGLNLPLANTGVFLQRISFGIGVDPFTIIGGVGFSVGPDVAGVSAVRVDGNFRLSFPGSPAARIEISTDAFCQASSCKPGAEQGGGDGLQVVSIPLGGFSFSADTDGQIAFAGHLGFDAAIASVDARLAGWIDGTRAFSIEGSGTACVFSVACAGAEGVVSSEGLAACGYVTLLAVRVAVGFGIRWPDDLSVMAGVCDIGPYRASRVRLAGGDLRAGGIGALSAQAGGAQTVTFPAGTPYGLVRLTGATGAPDVTLTAPDGTVLAAPVPPAPGVRTDRHLAFKDYAKRQTIFVVPKPGTQAWTITLQPGSSAITSVDQSTPLPAPSVKARVTGAGRVRTLAYTVKPQPGQSVRFAEVGGGVTHVLGTTTKAAGTIRFAPRDGRKGRRKIVAQVLQSGLPRTNLDVGTYSAPARALPSLIGPAIARRGPKSLAISWRPARNADTYRVRVRVNDGRRLLFATTAVKRRVTVPAFGRTDTATVTIQGVTKGLRTGPARSVVVRLPARKPARRKGRS